MDNLLSEEKDTTFIRWRLDKTNWTVVLDSISQLKSYYVGGNLFVDFEDGTFSYSLKGEVVEFSTGMRAPLTPEQHKKVFALYRQHKGETAYYRGHLTYLLEKDLQP